ncbi:hypothetical protein CK507_15610 [Pseudomonas sp. WN033]|nr:hypothetical protein CK507_15610 [Pseudomonas sp. WN033]
MISAFQRKQLLPMLVVLLALLGMSVSAVGETSSHGLAALAGEISGGQHDKSHSHDEFDEESDKHAHHDSSNHSHESLGHPTIRPVAAPLMSVRQLPLLAGRTPPRFHYRLERPPKAS